MHLLLDTHPGIHLNISTIFQLYRTKLKLYQRFFNISTVRHNISIYRQSPTRTNQLNTLPANPHKQQNKKLSHIRDSFLCTYAANASKASSASEPSVVIVIMLPVPIAKLIIPIMLFAFTVFPSFSMKISA